VHAGEFEILIFRGTLRGSFLKTTQGTIKSIIGEADVIINIILTAFLLISASPVSDDYFLRENFDSLDRWKQLTFPKIKKHTKYTIARENNNSILKAESDASASGLLLKKEFNVYEYPVVSWRWRIDNVYKNGNARSKSGDDYPIRVYVIFKYDPSTASASIRAQYGAAKFIYGEYPPHSSLNYIWANRGHSSKIITSPYTDRSKMIVLRYGDRQKGIWMTEKINIVNDYKKAFGESPPAIAGIAVMSDSDNTGESAAAYIDYIQISRR